MTIPKHKKRINITLERTTLTKLQQLAKEDRRSVSASIEIALEILFDNRRGAETPRKIKKLRVSASQR